MPPSPDDDIPWKENPFRWAKILKTAVVVALALAGLGLVAIAILLYVLFAPGPGRFDRARFEAIVEEARRLPIPPGEDRELMLADRSSPRSLRPRGEHEAEGRGGGAGRVWARRTKEGHLEVVIETSDMGHAGEYGFAYADDPLTPVPLDGSPVWSTLPVPGHLTLVEAGSRLDAHWWSVLYNLD